MLYTLAVTKPVAAIPQQSDDYRDALRRHVAFGLMFTHKLGRAVEKRVSTSVTVSVPTELVVGIGFAEHVSRGQSGFCAFTTRDECG